MGRRLKIMKRVAISAVIVLVLLGGGFLLATSLNREEEQTTKEMVPKIELTLNGVTLDEINGGQKRVDYTGNAMTVIDGEGSYSFDDVEIRGRGNASWSTEKKSYRIKLPRKVSILGLEKIKKWAMIPNNIDDSLMRNDLGYYIAGLLNENYPIKGEFVKFKVDDRDLGLYYMSELVTVGKNSIDLKDSMGILVEIDNVYCEAEEKYSIAKLYDCVSVKDVVAKDNMEEALDTFMDNYNEFEKLVKRGDYNMAEEKVDMESFAKYYLLSEFSSNLDAYVTSWYLYKDGEEDKIHSGIGWDFDGAFGNKKWWERDDNDIFSPSELMTRMKYTIDGWDDYDEGRCELLYGTLISPVMCYMVDIPEFMELVAKIYREKLMGRREEVLSYIYYMADYIRDEAIADSMLWNKGDFDGEIEYLIQWVGKRFDYFDELFGGGWPEPSIL